LQDCIALTLRFRVVAQIQIDGGRHQSLLDPELHETHLLHLNRPNALPLQSSTTYSVSFRDAVKLALNIPINYKKDPLDQNFFSIILRRIFPGGIDRLSHQDRSKNQPILKNSNCSISARIPAIGLL
jgi:hypothetical protein